MQSTANFAIVSTVTPERISELMKQLYRLTCQSGAPRSEYGGNLQSLETNLTPEIPATAALIGGGKQQTAAVPHWRLNAGSCSESLCSHERDFEHTEVSLGRASVWPMQPLRRFDQRRCARGAAQAEEAKMMHRDRQANGDDDAGTEGE